MSRQPGMPSRPRCLMQAPPDGVWVEVEDRSDRVDHRLLRADGQQGFDGCLS